MYFPEEQEANAADPVLARVEQKSRIATLVAQKEQGNVYRFDIRLQGEGETVFFDI
jgi:protocatechuate 3,4-dioxygenase alpha subunit